MTKKDTRGSPLPRLAKALKNLRKLEIIVEHLPYRELSPNSREHWAVKARAVKAQREEAGWLAKVQWKDQKPMTHARINYQFIVTDKRHRDIENTYSACKSFVDGLVDAGVLIDDDSKHLEVGSIKLSPGNTNQTIILIEEVV